MNDKEQMSAYLNGFAAFKLMCRERSVLDCDDDHNIIMMWHGYLNGKKGGIA